MEQTPPPARLLRGAGLVLLPGVIRPREVRAWLVGWRGSRGVLRRVPAPREPAARALLIHDMTWLHDFLKRLVRTGFPAPEPRPAFGGRSWTLEEGALWEVMSFLPGEIIGWAELPALEEVGAMLGRYHETVRGIEVAAQRPGAVPLAD